jgi:predicted dehydrogenase
VVDHQVVTMEHGSGAISTLIMHGHSDREERTIRYDGTRATLRARFQYDETSEITIRDHLTGEVECLRPQQSGERGHGGGDERLLRDFADAVREGRGEGLTSARVSLESHLLAFAAEESRGTGRVVQMEEYRREIEAMTR